MSYYLYGDTRRRGVALLRLKRMYAAAGLVLDSDELPDHLPAMLEFAAFAPAGYGDRVLAEHRVGLELLRLGLRDSGRAHADVLDARLRRRCRASASARSRRCGGSRPRARRTSRSASSRSRRPRSCQRGMRP